MSIFSKAKIREIFEDAEIEVSKDVLKKICDLHTDALDNLKDTVKELKTDLENAERERDDFKAKAPKDGEKNPFEEKYNKLKKEFDDYKDNIETNKVNDAKKLAYSKLLKDNKVSESCIDSILEITKLDDIQLDENGKIVDADTHNENIKNKWSSFIETTTITGANTHTPPANKSKNGEITKEAFNKMSYKEKLKIYNEDRKLYDELSK